METINFGCGTLFVRGYKPAKLKGQPTKKKGLKNRKILLCQMRPSAPFVKVGTITGATFEFDQAPNEKVSEGENGK